MCLFVSVQIMHKVTVMVTSGYVVYVELSDAVSISDISMLG